MGLVYLYVSTGQKVYREGAEYGSARFGNNRERKAFLSKNPFNDAKFQVQISQPVKTL